MGVFYPAPKQVVVTNLRLPVPVIYHLAEPMFTFPILVRVMHWNP